METLQRWEEGVFLTSLRELEETLTHTRLVYLTLSGGASEVSPDHAVAEVQQLHPTALGGSTFFMQTNRGVDQDMVIMGFAVVAMIVFTAAVLGPYARAQLTLVHRGHPAC